MIVKKGKRILIICTIVVFVSILIDFFINPKLVSLAVSFLLFGLSFYYTYRGYNWSRICLIILLIISGLGGSYGGVMILIESQHPAGILIVIMSLLHLSIGFILLFSKSVKAFVNRGKP